MSKTEYDFTKAEPIEFDKIKPGMLITHYDGVDFYIGKVVEISEESNDLWVDKNCDYVADRECQNYLIPKKQKPLPTEAGARIRLTADHVDHSKHGAVDGRAGACYTKNGCTGNWRLDGFSDSKPVEWFDGAEWEPIKVVPVGA